MSDTEIEGMIDENEVIFFDKGVFSVTLQKISAGMEFKSSEFLHMA